MKQAHLRMIYLPSGTRSRGNGKETKKIDGIETCSESRMPVEDKRDKGQTTVVLRLAN